MRLPLLGAAALALLVGTCDTSAQRTPCLHGENETREDRERREKAVELAHDINRAQAAARRFGPRADRGAYQTLDLLANVPDAPAGFRVQLDTDGTTYSFSIKDTLDPCRYAVFSDQSGDVYEGSPLPSRAALRLLSD